MNLLAAKIPEPRIKFSKSIGKFYYRMPMFLYFALFRTTEISVLKNHDFCNFK